jgi:hypothetical protein
MRCCGASKISKEILLGNTLLPPSPRNRLWPFNIAATRFSRWRSDENTTPAICSATSTRRAFDSPSCNSSTPLSPQYASVVESHPEAATRITMARSSRIMHAPSGLCPMWRGSTCLIACRA